MAGYAARTDLPKRSEVSRMLPHRLVPTNGRYCAQLAE
jgi:hypothetical protein